MKVRSTVARAMCSKGDIQELLNFMGDEAGDYRDLCDGDYIIEYNDTKLWVFSGDYLVQLESGAYSVIDKEDFDKFFVEVPEA